jgi:4-amino-4-deoxy-L-arabinose transferase-like glycosyltransferase
MIVVGLLELSISLCLFRGRDMVLKLFAVLWLSSNFLFYRMSNDFLHIYVCPCLGTLGDSLHLTRKQSGFLLEVLVLYLFLGSAFLLLAARSRANDSLNRGRTATGTAARPS